MAKKLLFFIVVSFLFTSYVKAQTPNASGVLFVNKNVAGGTQSGNSWANALPEAAVAFKAASQLNTLTPGTVTQIWVAGGTYKPMYTPEDGQNFSATPIDPRNVSFLMVNNVQLYGGFAATETTLNERDLTLTANASILSGDLGTPNVDTDNAYHVVLRVGTPTTTLNAELNGFTVTNGNADGNTTIQVNAGIIQKSHGGGIYNMHTSSDIMKVIIIKNKANSGAGMYNFNSQFKLINGLVVNNIATTEGGGIYNDWAGYVTVLNCTFYNNSLQDIHSTWGWMWVYNTILWNGIVGTNFADLTFNSCLFGVGLNASIVFTDAANGDFSLVNGSPAINVGNNQHWIANVGAITGNETDLAGNPRFVGEIDMGAFERPCSLSLISSQVNVSCNGATNGTATVIVSGGTTPYTYVWNNGQTTATATNLAAGTYEVTVTDANGCEVLESFTITEPPATTIAPPMDITVINDAGQCGAVVNYSLPTGIKVLSMQFEGMSANPATYTESGMTIITGTHLDVPWIVTGGGNGLRLHGTYTSTWNYSGGTFTPSSVVILNTPQFHTFVSSTGATITPTSTGIFVFPDTADWKNISSLQWQNSNTVIDFNSGIDIDNFQFYRSPVLISGINNNSLFPVGTTTNTFE